jgi:prevent-host-death family protein
MATITADHAKADFDALLRRAAAGEEIVITENGTPVARMIPAEQSSPAAAEARRELQVGRIAEQLRELRKGNRLGTDWTIRKLIEEGRE